ncbi:IclR family transcriptional regulator [Piscinibacter sp. XHJ-5]|uniref:IclR family transcriptional regulator n=1 Tax=Piscinibacter sp. XHJ-5 TaxID=3037797 RepID=UPI002452D0A3|nr:IclR family transcriptional regulator [Piscinibacter sp. XHJ-5]
MEATASRHVPPRRSSVEPPALVPALSRALTLLDRLAEGRQPMTLARLASELSLPKSSVHGLCNTLVSFGYLRRQDDGAFMIGPRVMCLAEAFVHGTSVAQEFSALWKDARTAPEETVLLSVLNGAEVVYVAARNGLRPLGLAFNVGMRLPAHLAATGRAMLAWHDEAFVRRLFPGPTLVRMAGKGPKTVAELMKELTLTRRRGHSIDDENVREGVYCIGAPVFDATGQPVAGIGVCIHKAMLGSDHGERQRRVVVEAARLLSRRLGGELPLPESAPAARRRTRS